MESYEGRASHKRNWLIGKINFRVDEGEGCLGAGLSLQANNIAIKCDKSEVAFATSSVPAHSFLN